MNTKENADISRNFTQTMAETQAQCWREAHVDLYLSNGCAVLP